MTYIESALYDFIKTILTRGYRTLRDPRYLPFSIFLVVMVGASTIAAFIEDLAPLDVNQTQADILLYVELGAAVAYLLTGFLLGKRNTIIQMSLIFLITGGFFVTFFFGLVPFNTDIAVNIAGVYYIAWIFIASIATFSLFRDLFENEIFGTILFLGKPSDDGQVMFRLVGWLVVFLNLGLGYVIYTNGQEYGNVSLIYSAYVVAILSIIAAIPLIGLQRKYDVFFTILTTFFMFTTIRIALLAYRSLSDTQGTSSFWDGLFSLFIALYAIQNAAVKGIKFGEPDEDDELSVEEKTMREQGSIMGFTSSLSDIFGDRGIILMILGVVIGFHTMQVQSFLGRRNIFQSFELTRDADIILLGYEVNLFVSLIIYVFSLLLFIILPSFRRYANPEVKRIPWAPPYDDLKILVSSIKDGDISWKGDVFKLVTGLATDKLKGRFGGKSSSGDRIRGTLDKMLRRAKDQDEEDK